MAAHFHFALGPTDYVVSPDPTHGLGWITGAPIIQRGQWRPREGGSVRPGAQTGLSAPGWARLDTFLCGGVGHGPHLEVLRAAGRGVGGI